MIVDEPRIVIEAPEDSELVMIEVQVRVLV